MWHAFVKISVKHILLEWPITTELFPKNGYDLNACHNVTDILYNTDVTSHIVKLIVIACMCLDMFHSVMYVFVCIRLCMIYWVTDVCGCTCVCVHTFVHDSFSYGSVCVCGPIWLSGVSACMQCDWIALCVCASYRCCRSACMQLVITTLSKNATE